MLQRRRARRTVDPNDGPGSLVRVSGQLTTGRQDACLVALPDLAPREFDCLRHVPLEVQPERTPVGEGGDLQLEIPGERGFFGSQLAQEVVQSRHRIRLYTTSLLSDNMGP